MGVTQPFFFFGGGGYGNIKGLLVGFSLTLPMAIITDPIPFQWKFINCEKSVIYNET